MFRKLRKFFGWCFVIFASLLAVALFVTAKNPNPDAQGVVMVLLMQPVLYSAVLWMFSAFLAWVVK